MSEITQEYLKEVSDGVNAYAKGIVDGANTVIKTISLRLSFEEKANEDARVENNKTPAKASK